MRKPDFCIICKRRLCSYCTADQCFCFCYSDSTIPPLLKSQISSFLSVSVTVQADLCRNWLETPKTGFLASRLKGLAFYSKNLRDLRAEFSTVQKLPSSKSLFF